MRYKHHLSQMVKMVSTQKWISATFEQSFAYFLKIWGTGGFQGVTGDNLPLAAYASATTMLI